MDEKKAEINRSVELVEILLYLAKEQEKTVQYLGNRVYLSSITDWFSPYKDHMAVKMTKKLITEESFFPIRPLRAILDLDNILSDDSHKLHVWAEETVRFAKESGFDDFFRTQSEHYAEILEYVSSCDFDIWISYIENYFKSKPDNKFDYFAMGIAHEYAHCYVNPVVEGHKELLKHHTHFFEIHENMPQSYNVDYAVINEYFVRAFQIRFMEENHMLFPEFNLSGEYERQRSMFIFIDDFVDLLKQFEHCGLTFGEFYTNHIDRFLSEREKR